ncbi:MAG: SDR family oxidoreductase [Rhodospirillales bacterium]|jgi:NAD(P)-dependent dehydrogenase (short-subunit alcohol dehydrogenase family)|nr:SDR family oxidoreductase [Rhodospirillales bacterium]HJO96374.1 SDR family oxidoreductase [Rhodospirillales bacterium]
MHDLSGKIVLLTGASQGIGAVTSTILGQAGASVIAHHHAAPDLEGAQAALSNTPATQKTFLAADYEDLSAVDQLWQQAADWKGRIDAIVLNAATMDWHSGFDEEDAIWEQSWSRHLQVNVIAQVRLMRAAVGHFQQNGGGVIVVISSWLAHRGSTNPAMMAYAASKGAMKAAAQTVARAYATDGVRCYMIAPGTVRTHMGTAFAELQGIDEKELGEDLPMGELIPPEEIGELVAFLITGPKHMSGATLDVTGANYLR